MPIALEACDHPPLCHGYRWLIQNEVQLAQLVAWVVVGNYRHAEHILEGLTAPAPTPPLTAKEQAKLLLTNLPNDQVRWHRDGWVFQIISWLAAAILRDGRTIMSTPHAGPARKGFDAVLVPLEPSGAALEGIVICEDKATDNPRQKIHDEVWPEIEKIEAGERDAELLQELTTILERGNIPNIDSLIQAVHWQNRRRYRVSVTVAPLQNGTARRAGLFAGYDVYAPGADLGRRCAETLCLDDLRAWMDQFCALVVTAIDEI